MGNWVWLDVVRLIVDQKKICYPEIHYSITPSSKWSRTWHPEIYVKFKRNGAKNSKKGTWVWLDQKIFSLSRNSLQYISLHLQNGAELGIQKFMLNLKEKVQKTVKGELGLAGRGTLDS